MGTRDPRVDAYIEAAAPFAKPILTAVREAVHAGCPEVEETIRCQRTVSAFMEPRAAIGSYDAAEERYTLISGCQGAHRLRHGIRGPERHGCHRVAPEAKL